MEGAGATQAHHPKVDPRKIAIQTNEANCMTFTNALCKSVAPLCAIEEAEEEAYGARVVQVLCEMGTYEVVGGDPVEYGNFIFCLTVCLLSRNFSLYGMDLPMRENFALQHHAPAEEASFYDTLRDVIRAGMRKLYEEEQQSEESDLTGLEPGLSALNVTTDDDGSDDLPNIEAARAWFDSQLRILVHLFYKECCSMASHTSKLSRKDREHHLALFLDSLASAVEEKLIHYVRVYSWIQMRPTKKTN